MNPFQKEPVVVAGAVQLVFVALVTLNIVHLTEAQIMAVVAALTAVLGLFVRQSVTPVQLGRERIAAGADPFTPRNN